MKKCISCQQMLPDQAQFCSVCRAQQPPLVPVYANVRRKPNYAVSVLSVFLVICIIAIGAWKLNLFPDINEKIDSVIADDEDQQKDSDKDASIAPEESNLVDEAGRPVGADAFGSPPIEPDNDQPPSAANPYIDSSIDKKALEKDIAAIETAFSSGDLKAIETVLHPQMQEQLMETFQKNQSRLQDIADLLKTKKPIALSDGYAEYQVDDNGKFYTVIFQKYEGDWLLVGL